MKAITLIQPWASLVAIGAKRIETRSWATSYRGPHAIHASARYPGWAKAVALEEPAIRAALLEALLPPQRLITGHIIAVCDLVDCFQITPENQPAEPERSYGDYTPGRYAWALNDVRKLPRPIPAKGRLGLWEHDLKE